MIKTQKDSPATYSISKVDKVSNIELLESIHNSFKISKSIKVIKFNSMKIRLVSYSHAPAQANVDGEPISGRIFNLFFTALSLHC